MNGIAVRHRHVHVARPIAGNVDDAHALVEPQARFGYITIEASVQRREVRLRPPRASHRADVRLLGDGAELRIAEHVRQVEFHSPDDVVLAGKYVFEVYIELQRVAELERVSNVEHASVETGRFGHGGVRAVAVERAEIEFREGDAIAFDQVEIDPFRTARASRAIGDRALIGEHRRVLDQSMPYRMAELHAHEIRPKVIAGEKCVQTRARSRQPVNVVDCQVIADLEPQ